jgi:uncharacterized protein (DUF488 family)
VTPDAKSDSGRWGVGMATTLYTIGFTKSTAEHFFERLRQARIRCLVDIRLNNTSTLAGFTKQDDLPYFLRTILDAEYLHEPLLAPTPELLKGIRSKQLPWDEYAARYNALIQERNVTTVLQRATFEGPTVLLCSEASAEHCHRRLAAEHLAAAWSDLTIAHL